MRQRLTATAVERLKPPHSGQVDVFDMAAPGLALRISHGGSRTWCAFVRVRGRLRRVRLGRYPLMSLADARKAWGEAVRTAEAGHDPGRKIEPGADTVEVIVAEWLRRDQSKNRSAGEVKRLFDRDVIPQWEGRKISDLTRHDCLVLIDGVADRGATIMARRLHAHLHRLFSWSVGRGLIDQNPMASVPKPGAERKRERVLTDPELAAVWQAAAQIGYPFGPIVRLLILTGARREEIGSLQWSEIDFGAAEIALAGDRTKNGQPHTIPLSPSAIEVLRSCPRLFECPFVFSTNARTAVSGWTKAKAKLDQAVTEIAGEPLAPWVLHDLRRTVATGLQRLGIAQPITEAVLGHVGSRSGIVGVYQKHHYADEKRQALTLWAEHLARLGG